MKKIIDKKYLLILLTIMFVILFTIIINSVSTIEDIKFVGVVNTQKLNIRQGPGIQYSIIGGLNIGDNVNVIGKIEDWYIIQTQDNTIGVCSKQYINNAEDNSMVIEMFDLINKQREDNNIKLLKMDNELCKIAQLKAEDMVKNEYFAHESPTYGTPFDMMKNNNIDYLTAGENIAGYVNIAGSVDAWMKSEGHKENILSNGYNYTGIGIAKSEKYGYIFVQMFMGKYENK